MTSSWIIVLFGACFMFHSHCNAAPVEVDAGSAVKRFAAFVWATAAARYDKTSGEVRESGFIGRTEFESRPESTAEALRDVKDISEPCGSRQKEGRYTGKLQNNPEPSQGPDDMEGPALSGGRRNRDSESTPRPDQDHHDESAGHRHGPRTSDYNGVIAGRGRSHESKHDKTDVKEESKRIGHQHNRRMGERSHPAEYMHSRHFDDGRGENRRERGGHFEGIGKPSEYQHKALAEGGIRPSRPEYEGHFGWIGKPSGRKHGGDTKSIGRPGGHRPDERPESRGMPGGHGYERPPSEAYKPGHHAHIGHSNGRGKSSGDAHGRHVKGPGMPRGEVYGEHRDDRGTSSAPKGAGLSAREDGPDRHRRYKDSKDRGSRYTASESKADN